MNVDPAGIWSAAGVLAGLQVAAFTLRINREIAVSDRADLTWLPLADLLNLLSLLAIALGVFTLPTLGIGGAKFAQQAFGVAVLLLVGYAFALAGHYEMYNPRTPRSWKYCPRQEQVVLVLVLLAIIIYIVLAVVF